MGLAVVRSAAVGAEAWSAADLQAFEQELVDQHALAYAAGGCVDSHIDNCRRAVVEFARFLSAPLWTATPDDADRYLLSCRRQAGNESSTVAGKGYALAQFYEFLIDRYQQKIHAVTGHVVVQPIDEYNRPRRAENPARRIPPSDAQVEALFTAWGASVVDARKYLPAARDYFAASLWRRAGLRINETVMLDNRDWRADLGAFGKLHVRHGKGSNRLGPKARMVPAINGVAELMAWWVGQVRPLYGRGWDDPDGPLLPSERYDRRRDGVRKRCGEDGLRSGLSGAVARFLPAWGEGRLTPHTLRHYCASSLYRAGMDLMALQELLGHQWVATTTRYVHVHRDQVERSWARANERVSVRLVGQGD